MSDERTQGSSGRPRIHGDEIRKRVLELRAQGMSVRGIAEVTHVSKSSVFRIISEGENT